MIRILIADDHPLVREGLKKILKEESDIEIVGEASNSQELLEHVQKQRPDAIVTDLSMPGKSGLDALKEIKELAPHLPVLILSMHPEERFAVRAIKAGAAGYLTKESAPQELVKALRKVVDGGKYITPTVAEKLASEYAPESKRLPHELLSDREFQILCLISSGKSMKQIAEELMLSLNTVHGYRSRLLEKMNMRTNIELTQYAIRYHLIE